MVTKGQDHSLAVYPRAAFEQLARRAAQTSRSNPEARAFLRNLAAAPMSSIPTRGGVSPCRPTTAATPTCPRTAW